MIEFWVEVDNAAPRRMLQGSRGQIERATRLWLDDASLLVLRDLTLYPAQPSGSTYVRTMDLQRSWSRTPVEGTGLEMRRRVGSNENIAPYNRRVQDAVWQSRRLRHWSSKTVQAVLQRRTPTLTRMYQDRLAQQIG